MKNYYFLFTLALLPLLSAAQCNDFYIMEQGTEWTYDNINAKGKSTGKNQQIVKAYQNTATGFKATVYSAFTNDKGKKVREGDMEMTCENEVLIMDMKKFIPQEQQKAFDSYEMKIEAQNLELPSKLKPGQLLKDGSITLTAVGSPIPMTLSVQITNRKVEGKETITTPAGTFECYKISNKTTTQTKMGMNITFEFNTVEWIAEKVGMVKSESFDKNGKLAGYTLLINRK